MCALFVFFLRSQARAQSKRSHAKVNDGSKYAFTVHEEPLVGPVDIVSPESVGNPKNRQSLTPKGNFQNNENLA